MVVFSMGLCSTFTTYVQFLKSYLLEKFTRWSGRSSWEGWLLISGCWILIWMIQFPRINWGRCEIDHLFPPHFIILWTNGRLQGRNASLLYMVYLIMIYLTVAIFQVIVLSFRLSFQFENFRLNYYLFNLFSLSLFHRKYHY